MRAIQQLEEGALELQTEMGVHPLLVRKFNLVHRQPPVAPRKPSIGPGSRGHRVNRDGIPIRTYATENEILHQISAQQIRHQPPKPAMPVMYDEKTGVYSVIVCHFFSGRRREGDCHWHLERAEMRGPLRVQFLILSLDTAVSDTLCNLDNGPNWQRILQVLELALVAFGLTGPPCETYSAARHIEPPDSATHWPRPLRSPGNLWGLRFLRCREIRQLTTGSRLLLHSVVMEALVNIGGGSTLMGHPAERTTGEVPAAWRAPAMVGLLRHLPEYKANYVEQWRYGSKGIKPTNLRTIGCYKPWLSLQRHADPQAVRPVVRLEGLNDLGQWRTSEAKEYPEGLSRAIASIVKDTVQHRLTFRQYRIVNWSTVPDDVRKWIQEVQQSSSQIRDVNWRPDYQG